LYSLPAAIKAATLSVEFSKAAKLAPCEVAALSPDCILASLGLRTAINGNISLPILQQLFTCTPTSDESIFKFESMTSFFILSEPLNDLDLDRLIEVGEGISLSVPASL
jgi:hypothetical protein